MKKRLITSFLLSIFLTSCVVGSFYHSDFGGASVTDDWPMFQHDAVHSGASSSNAPSTNATLWSRITLSSFGGPAVANGSVYILSGPDYLDCIDAQSGATNWDYQIPGQNGSANAGNPAVVNGNVYFATETGVYCLDASSGTLIWNYTTGVGAMDYSPTVADGKVYVGSWDNKVYCLDANTGALVWNFSTGDYVWSSPAVSNGVVYIGSHNGKIYALNETSGDLIWSYQTGLSVDAPPAVSSGLVYVGSGDCNVYCFNASTGDLVWNTLTGDPIQASSPAIANGKIYIGSDNMYCLDAATGVLQWTFKTGGEVLSSPAVADDKVYFGSEDNKTYCVDANTGALIWSYDTQFYVGMSPAIANGILYIGSDITLYAFSDSSASPTPMPTSTPTAAPTNQPTPAPTSETTLFPTASPSPAPSVAPTIVTVRVATSAGATFDLNIKGNVSSTQFSNFVIETNQSAKSTTLGFSITGLSGNVGFSNITIPKSAMPNESSPTVYIDGQPAQNQGYAQDANNYYVWYTTHFSTHQVTIVFTKTLAPSPASSLMPNALEVVCGAAAGIAIVIATILAIRFIVSSKREG